MLRIHCLGMCVLDLAELVVSAEETVAISALEALDGGVNNTAKRRVEGACLEEAIVNFEEIDLVLEEKRVGKVRELTLEEVLASAVRGEEGC